MDDLGFSMLIKHGGPVFDRLAARGAFWPRCWVTPECRPSRAAILTGCYGYETGYVSNHLRPKADALIAAWRNLPAMLRDAGYACAVAGKWQHEFEPYEIGLSEQLTWRSTGDARFLSDYAGPLEPEGGAVPGRPPRYDHPYLETNDALRPSSPGDFGPHIASEWAEEWIRGAGKRFLLVNDLLIHKEWDHRRGRIAYPYETAADTVQGALLNLEAFVHNIPPDTLFIVTSDNGTAAGGGKSDPRKQRGCRSFALAFGPGVAPGIRHQMIDATDIMPTILEAAGVRPCPGGVSFLPQIGDPEAPGRPWIASVFMPDTDVYAPGEHGYGAAVRTDRGVLIDFVGDVYKHKRPNDPMAEYFNSGRLDQSAVDHALGIRSALMLKR